MSVTRTVTGGVAVVAASGELDNDTGGQLRDALLPGGIAVPERVVVDMSNITFMDSSGINILVGAHQACEAMQGWLRLANPTASVLRVIELVGLDQVIPCYPSVDHAAAS
ncbi:STAS domain-containing protein [Streptomyces microflavus]|uniref:STAS domain-containing protein n=1 Tax=Streptomyces microflavus TaxID=1919 RepID=UPI0035E342C6